MTRRVILAPFAGWLGPLAEVSDAAFAAGMVGEGVAIDPADTIVRAPLDGVVSSLPASRHAVSIRADDGLEILVHVGLDTVTLGGRGFTAHVAPGDRVRMGHPLLTLDLDVIADGARSLATPIVVAAGGSVVRAISVGRKVRAGDPIFEVLASEPDTEEAAAPTLSRSVSPVLPHGLHARPAARIAACAKAFDARVHLHLGDHRAEATSLVAMMGLGLTTGQELGLSASGPQAAQALDALEALIADGLEDADGEPARPTVVRSPSVEHNDDGELILSGVTASPGLAVGRVVRLRQAEIMVATDGRDATEDARALDTALGKVRERLGQAALTGPAAGRAVMAAHLAFLDDPALVTAARRAIAEGRSAGYAWREATRAAADVFRATGDPRMAERADDLLDLERQILIELGDGAPPPPPALGPGSVIIADDLLPSQLMGLEPGHLAGLCTARGGPTSHVAILAAALGAPALVAVGEGLAEVEDGALAVLDADGGRLIAHPSAARQAAAQSDAAARARRRMDARARALDLCHTRDGVRIEVFANLGDAAEAVPAITSGAEGCGLLRSEFLFLDRETAPSEEDQLDQYQSIADAMDGRTLIIRTLDAGGDKPLAYLPLPREDNPALGMRGVRAGLHRPDILMTQFRAICRVRSAGKVAVMLPMVASSAEVRQARAMLERAAAETGRAVPRLGVMVETPAAAVTVDRLAPAIDFISIGTNDLTQYTLAMDRQNPALAAQLDGLHPAVLRLIAQAAEGAEPLEWIGVCGGLASEPLAAPLLVGLGVRELSAAPAMIPEIKAAIRSLTLADCRRLAAEALVQDSAERVRAVAADRLPALTPRAGAIA